MIREIPHRDGGGFFFPSNLGIGGFTPTHRCRKPSVADRTTDSNNAKQAGIFSIGIPTLSHRQQKDDLSSAKSSAMTTQKVTFHPLIRIILTNTFPEPVNPLCHTAFQRQYISLNVWQISLGDGWDRIGRTL